MSKLTITNIIWIDSDWGSSESLCTSVAVYITGSEYEEKVCEALDCMKAQRNITNLTTTDVTITVDDEEEALRVMTEYDDFDPDYWINGEDDEDEEDEEDE